MFRVSEQICPRLQLPRILDGWPPSQAQMFISHLQMKKKKNIMFGKRVGWTLYHLAINPRYEEEAESTIALPSSLSPGISTWHRQLTYVSYNTIVKMASSGVVDGLDIASTVIPSEPCTGCAYGKHQRLKFPVGRVRATYTGQLIHSDLCGPM
jgi:hypothetical protein